MKWLTDIVFAMLAARIAGIIVAWHGSIATIPTGWALCDGTLGTPDLRDKEIVGAGLAYSPDDEGGNRRHKHPFAGDGHTHVLTPAPVIAAGAPFPMTLLGETTTGTTGWKGTRGPYRAHCFIKRL